MNEKPGSRQALKIVLAGAAVVFAIALSVHLLRDFLGAKVEVPKRVVQEVRIIRPPPPPPDTEPPPPPPPEEEVDLPEPEPESMPEPSNDPPAGEQLGIDAVGSGAGDGFGLVGRPGGRDLLGSGGSYTAYPGLMKNEILDRLGADKKTRSGSYSVVVRLWVRRDGTIEKFNLVGSTGDKERDRAIEGALSLMSRFSQIPPPDMPQPVSLRIVSRAS